MASLEERFRARVAGGVAGGGAGSLGGQAAERDALGALCAARARQACTSILVGEWHAAHAQQTRYEATQREVRELLLRQQARHAVVAGAFAAEGAALSRVTALLDGTHAALKQRGAERRARLAASVERRAASQSRSVRGESRGELRGEAPERASGGDMHAQIRATDDLARDLCTSLELPTDIAAMQQLTWGDVADAALEQGERLKRAAETDRDARELAHAYTRRVAATLDGVNDLSVSSAALFDTLTRGYPRSLEEEAAAAAALASPSASPSARQALGARVVDAGAEDDARVALSQRSAVWPRAGERALYTEPLVPPPLQRILSRNTALRAEMRTLYEASKRAVAEEEARASAAARPRGAWVANALMLGAVFEHDPKAAVVKGGGSRAADEDETGEAVEAPDAAVDPSELSVRSSVRHRAGGIASDSVLSPSEFEVTAALEVAQLGAMPAAQADAPEPQRGRASVDRGARVVGCAEMALQNAQSLHPADEAQLDRKGSEQGATAAAAAAAHAVSSALGVSASMLGAVPAAAAAAAHARAPPGTLVISPTLSPAKAPGSSPMLSPTILTGGRSRRSVDNTPVTTVTTGGGSRRSIALGAVAKASSPPLRLEPPAPAPPGALSCAHALEPRAAPRRIGP